MDTENLHTENANVEDVWFRIWADSPGCGSPADLRRLLRILFALTPCEFVKVTNLEACGFFDDALESRVIPVSLLDEALDNVTQMEWGRFFFYRDRRAAEAETLSAGLESEIATSTLTVCVCDNSWFTVFTKAPAASKALIDAGWRIQSDTGPLAPLLQRAAEL